MYVDQLRIFIHLDWLTDLKVPEFCRVLEEKEVLKNAFDLIFAFDEAIAMGYKERVNLQQIKHFMTMESNDEIRAKQDEKVNSKFENHF